MKKKLLLLCLVALLAACGDESDGLTSPLAPSPLPAGNAAAPANAQVVSSDLPADARGGVASDGSEEDGATLSDIPKQHSGDEFTLTVTLSGTPVSRWRTMQDSTVSVAGGSVERVRRAHEADEDRNYVWEVTVEPNDGTGDVTVTVRDASATVPHTAGNSIVVVQPRTATQNSPAIVLSVTSLDLVEPGPSRTFTWHHATDLPAGDITITASVSDPGAAVIATDESVSNNRGGSDRVYVSSMSWSFDSGRPTSSGPITVRVRAANDFDDSDETATVTFSASGAYNAPDVSLTLNIAESNSISVTNPAGAPSATRNLPQTVVLDSTDPFTYTISGSRATEFTVLRELLPMWYRVTSVAGVDADLRQEYDDRVQYWEFDPDEDAAGDYTVTLTVSTDLTAFSYFNDRERRTQWVYDYTRSGSNRASFSGKVFNTPPGGGLTSGVQESNIVGDWAVTQTRPDLPEVSLAGDTVTKAPNVTLDFVVTLDRAATGTVTMDYQTRDGTGKAGEDYTATNGTLTFAAGQTSKTVSVPVLDDGRNGEHKTNRETLSFKLSNPTGAFIAPRIGHDLVTGFIMDP